MYLLFYFWRFNYLHLFSCFLYPWEMALKFAKNRHILNESNVNSIIKSSISLQSAISFYIPRTMSKRALKLFVISNTHDITFLPFVDFDDQEEIYRLQNHLYQQIMTRGVQIVLEHSNIQQQQKWEENKFINKLCHKCTVPRNYSHLTR